MPSEPTPAPGRVEDPKEEEQTSLTVDVNVPRIYANGLGFGTTNADVVLVLQTNNVPVAIVNLSYTLAKTLTQKMGEMISDLEERTGHDIMTTDFIDQAKKAADAK